MSHPKRWTRADAVQRATKAYALRVSGLTWSEIARECRFSSASTASRAVRRWRESLPDVDMAQQREIAESRGEWLWRQAQADVADGNPGAVASAVKVLERQAKLMGTDAPKVAEVVHSEGVSLSALFERVPRVEAPELPDGVVIEAHVVD